MDCYISNATILFCLNLVLPLRIADGKSGVIFPHEADKKELHTYLRFGICNSKRLQLPTSSAASSMRRSQSAVEATADYLGARVVRLSHLNPDEANRFIFIYKDSQR